MLFGNYHWLSWCSVSKLLGPLAGYYAGPQILYVYLLKLILFLALAPQSASSPYLILSWLHLPTLCGMLYWSAVALGGRGYRWRLLLALIPLLCMALFVCHPVGGQAFQYTFVWLIPLLTVCISHRSMLLHAYASTFIAHAVGSVIWLYTCTTVPAFWLALIPRVICERSVLAAGMALVVVAVPALYQMGMVASRALSRGKQSV